MAFPGDFRGAFQTPNNAQHLSCKLHREYFSPRHKKKGPGFFRDHIICILYSACHAFSTFHTLPHNHCFCRFCNLFGALFASQNIQKLAANRKRSFKKPPPLSPSVITTKSRRKAQKVDTLGRLTAPRDVLLLLLCPTAPQRNIQKLAANRKHSLKNIPNIAVSYNCKKSPKSPKNCHPWPAHCSPRYAFAPLSPHG